MRHCLIICAALLAGCGPDPAPSPGAALRLLDLTPCPGWTGPTPTTERQLARAALAERTGRLCANAKLGAVRVAVGP